LRSIVGRKPEARLCFSRGRLIYLPRTKFAAVAELVDALASGANLRKRVGVQISPAAQAGLVLGTYISLQVSPATGFDLVNLGDWAGYLTFEIEYAILGR
jgi:hypothetical protein